MLHCYEALALKMDNIIYDLLTCKWYQCFKSANSLLPSHVQYWK